MLKRGNDFFVYHYDDIVNNEREMEAIKGTLEKRRLSFAGTALGAGSKEANKMIERIAN